MKSSVLTLLCVVAAGCGAAAQQVEPVKAAQSVAIADRDLGLSKTSVFDTPDPPVVDYPEEQGKLLPRAFEGQPPRVPHDVQGNLPITLKNHDCLSCHGAGPADASDPTAIPPSHFLDLRNAPTTPRKEVAGSRWVCTACHVPQALIEPPVGNGF